ncbi:MAG: hypothetical protein LBQ47_01335, partial [Endomicrobium sp.]|nr:hypothetical protein [Endomicrobium sp.]
MLKKLISLSISVSLLLSLSFAQPAYALQTSAPPAVSENTSAGLTISADYGKIIDRHTFEESKYRIINIQDLHCHGEVQKNISAIIDSLSKNAEISAIFVEGGYGAVDLSLYKNIKDKALREKITEELLLQGRLTGTEYFYLKSGSKIPLFGLEDKSVHEANLERLSSILKKQERYNGALLKIKSEIKWLQDKYLSRENKKFNAFLESYADGKISAAKYYSVLSKYVEKVSAKSGGYNALLNFSPEKYPVFASYLNLLKDQKKINYNKASYELQLLISRFKEILPYSKYNQLFLETNGFENIYDLAAAIPAIASANSIEIKENSDVARLIKYALRAKLVNPVELLNDERKIKEDLRIAFSKSGGEAEISFLSDFYPCLQSFFNTKITADDLNYFNSEYEKFSLLYDKYSYKNYLKDLQNDIAFLSVYHNTNEERNRVFIKNIENSIDVSGANSVVIAVTGGFHSAALADIFKRSKISYTTIMPQITQESKTAEKKYEKFALSGESFSKQALALSVLAQSGSAAIATSMLTAALNTLSDSDYNEENINSLADLIKEILNADVQLQYLDNLSMLTFPDGTQIILMDSDGKISEPNKSNAESALSAKAMSAGQIKRLAAEAASAADLAASFIINPQIDAVVKSAAKAAASAGLTSGDMIFEIAANENLPEIIDGMDKDIIRKLPDAVQKALLRAYERDNLINSQERIYARIFLAAYDALKLDKAALDDVLLKNDAVNKDTSAGELVKKLNASGIVRFDMTEIAKDMRLVRSESGYVQDDIYSDRIITAIADAVNDGKIIAFTFEGRQNEKLFQWYEKIHLLIYDFSEIIAWELQQRGFAGVASKVWTFAVKEMLKNAFVHGNGLDGSLDIYFYVNKENSEITVVNKVAENKHAPDSVDMAVARSILYGERSGVELMKYLGNYKSFTEPLSDNTNMYYAVYG